MSAFGKDPIRSRRPAPGGIPFASSDTLNDKKDPPYDSNPTSWKPNPPIKTEYVDKSLRSDDRAGMKSSKVPIFLQKMGGEFLLQRNELILLGVITFIGAFIRLWNLSWPSSVVFDEVHFGGFANKYLQGKYFVDVHPPLAKLIFAFLAKVGGMKGGAFDFHDIGSDYSDQETHTHVPYVLMRQFPAVLGLLLVPLTYIVLRGVKLRPTSALLGAILVLFDNALATQSRYILLDSPLVFLTVFTIFAWVGFSNEDQVPRDRLGRQGPFSTRWWAWLLATGVSLGLVLSVKWVGLFTVATIGIHTIMQLWTWLGNTRVPMTLWTRHFVARAVALLVIPVMIYTLLFAVHFAVLPNSGDGDGFMSANFQHTLKGKEMSPTVRDIVYGAQVVIRHAHTNGGYLHSHPHPYPAGSQQQQITLYPHIDTNNHWTIVNQSTFTDADILDALSENNQNRTRIPNGETIILRHTLTAKKLHSHDIKPPVTEVDYQKEVSGYGFPDFDGDANDLWVIEIDEEESDTSRDKHAAKELHALTSMFRLRHVMSGCYLFSHKVRLPEWGYGQQEVTCNRSPSKENALWFVEWTDHPSYRPDDVRINFRRPSFFSNFWELQKVMWITNSGLVERHAYDSRPQSWPWLRRGINFWSKSHRQVYLLGNPTVWWSAFLSVFVYAAARGFLILRAQRGYKDLNSTVTFYDKVSFIFFSGYILHYFPFFLMHRQLFLHHYLPALWFSIALLSTVFDFATRSLQPKTALKIVLALFALTVLTYHRFSPLISGEVWTKAACQKGQWLRHWDFACDSFLESKNQYYGPEAPRDRAEVWSSALVAAQAAQSASLEAKLEREAQQPGRPLVADDSKLETQFELTAQHTGDINLDDPQVREDQKRFLSQQEEYILGKLFPRPKTTASPTSGQSSEEPSSLDGVAEPMLQATSDLDAEEPADILISDEDRELYLSLLKEVQDRKIFIDAVERAEKDTKKLDDLD